MRRPPRAWYPATVCHVTEHPRNPTIPFAGARAPRSPPPEPLREAEGETGVGFEPGAGFDPKSGGEEHATSKSKATTTRVRRIFVLRESDRFYRANPKREAATRRAGAHPSRR